MSHQAVTKVQGIMILAVLLLAGGAYYYANPSAPSPTAPTAPDAIKIGGVLPLTGTFAREGLFFRTAYEIVTKEINDGGGLFIKEYNKKIPIKLIILDDESDKAKSVRLYENLATVDKVDAFIGGYSTPLVLAHTIVPEREKIPYINGGGASTEIYVKEDGTRRSQWVFGLLALIRYMSRMTMDMIKSEVDAGNLKKPVKIALVWQNTAHGRDYRNGVLEKVKEFPGYFDIVLNEPFEFGATDYTSLLVKVKASQADIFLSDSHLPHYLQIHRQYLDLGLYGSHVIVSHGARGPEKKARDEFKDKADYLVAVLWWTERLPYPQAKAFIEKWKKSSNLPVEGEWYPALGYETARTLYKAIEKAGSLDKAKIRDALQNIQITDSIIPEQKIFFDERGLLPHPYVAIQNLPGGKVSIVWPADAREGKLVYIK